MMGYTVEKRKNDGVKKMFESKCSSESREALTLWDI